LCVVENSGVVGLAPCADLPNTIFPILQIFVTFSYKYV
jgi:hypothetical protein